MVNNIKFWFRRKFWKLFIWMGKKLFKQHTIWKDGDVDVATFSNVVEWTHKYQRSKKELGVRTPRLHKKALNPA